VTKLTARAAGLRQIELVPRNVAPATPMMEESMADRRDMHTEGTEDRAKGKAKEAEGKIRSKVADAVDDESEQVKGYGQQIKGKVQQGIGKAKQNLDPNPGRDDV
jgi:uncharacterized protein YjbJ (UPF0337 family)